MLLRSYLGLPLAAIAALLFFACGGLFACGGSSKAPTTVAPKGKASSERLNKSVPAEKVDIEVKAARSGHSLVVRVLGIGRGHQSGQQLENPKAWHVTAKYDGTSPLRQVLAGPAKVSREPTGAALGSQWDIEVQFMVAFALPDRAGTVSLRVQAPSGEIANRTIPIEAPAEKLSLR